MAQHKIRHRDSSDICVHAPNCSVWIREACDTAGGGSGGRVCSMCVFWCYSALQAFRSVRESFIKTRAAVSSAWMKLWTALPQGWFTLAWHGDEAEHGIERHMGSLWRSGNPTPKHTWPYGRFCDSQLVCFRTYTGHRVATQCSKTEYKSTQRFP